MKKKIVTIFSTVLILSLIVGTNVFAASITETIKVEKGQIWNTRNSTTRTMQYSYMYARAYSVYPINGGTDNYTRVQVSATNASGTLITLDAITLYETATASTKIYIKEGYLNTSAVRFRFRGNDVNLPAYTHVNYNAQ